MASIAVLAPASAPAQASAASPVLEFVSPASAFPIGFTADGGAVIAEMDEFSSVVHCTGSHGGGEITGPRSTISDYAFTECEAVGGSHAGQPCQSEGANAKEITAEAIEADLVYIDQAKHEVGMLLNPDEGVYIEFECGGEEVDGFGSFLSPVGPINKEATSFTAFLSQSNALQIPNEYENENGEKLEAIPMGEREGQPAATTGVELSFAIETSAPLEIKAVTAAEIEAKQHEEEAAAAKKREEEAAAKKRQEEEAAKKRQEEEAAAKKRVEEAKRARLRSKALRQCRKAHSKHRRIRCEKRVKSKYATPSASGKPKTY